MTLTSTSIITYGLGGVAVFGILAIILQKLASGSKVKDALKAFKKKEKQKQLKETVKTLSKEQEVINQQLQVAETSSEESKKKVQKIVQKAAVQVQRILQEEKIQVIDDEIEEGWSKL